METKEILKNIGERCGGELYLGVVGPVRVGKSTFIKNFMEQAVIPYVTNEAEKKRMIDELPQSGEGKTISTMEPKFIPNTAASIQFEDGLCVNVRLVDCVGYVLPDAKGYRDENGVRMVHTPWFQDPIPFDEAAKCGTQKVIQDHSMIGIVITTDGSIVDIARESYVEAENEVIQELIQIGKPFVIVVNSKEPGGNSCRYVVEKLREKYNVPVLAMACDRISEKDIHEILREALYEFPVTQISIETPKWVSVLNDSHWLKNSLNGTINESMVSIGKLREIENIVELLKMNEYIEKASLTGIDVAKGTAFVQIDVLSGLYHTVLKEILGKEISDKSQLIEILQEFSVAKKEYDAISSALKMVKQTGYGFASSSLSDIQLSTPELVKQQGRYGVRIKAVAPSIHMIKVDVESIFEPIIGTKSQSEELIQYLLRDEENKDAIWESDIFGRKLSDLIKDGLNSKLSMIPESARIRLQSVLAKLVNRGKGNVIAIVL